MPPNKANTTELVFRLGLLAPFTKSARDWAKHPAVRTLYVQELDSLSEQYSDRSNIDIRASLELRYSASNLFAKYGPDIWARDPDGGGRPWLFEAGDERTRGYYPEDLYFDDEAHFDM